MTQTGVPCCFSHCLLVLLTSLHPHHLLAELLVPPQAAHNPKLGSGLGQACPRGPGRDTALPSCSGQQVKAVCCHVPQLAPACLYSTACLTWWGKHVAHRTVQIYTAENRTARISVTSPLHGAELRSQWKCHMLAPVCFWMLNMLATFDRKYALNIMLAWLLHTNNDRGFKGRVRHN